MKIILHLLLGFIISFTLTGCKKSKVFNHPDYEKTNMKHIGIGIERIELTDTATIADISLYNLPGYWVAMSSDVKLIGKISNKEYALKFMDGMGPDLMIHVDSTGYISTKLFFEPIEEIDTIVDLIEDDYEVKNIKLYDYPADKIKTNISGTLNEMGASWLVLMVEKGNLYTQNYVVPVRNGKFNYDLYTDEPLIVRTYIGKELLEGYVSAIVEFWSEGGNIILNYPCNDLENYSMTAEGLLTQELNDIKESEKLYTDELDENFPALKRFHELQTQKLFYKPEFYSLREEIKKSKVGWERRRALYNYYNFMDSDDYISEEGKKAIQDYEKIYEIYGDSIKQLKKSFKHKQYSKPSLTNLYKILKGIKYDNGIDQNIEWFNLFYADTFTNHSYHKYIKELSDLVAPIPGNHFININFSEINGNRRVLSDIIDNKISLLLIRDIFDREAINYIDTLKNMYSQNMNKDFEIVEIILYEKGKHNSDKLGKYKAPWPILKDLEDSAGVRMKYRMGKEKMKTLLIDKEGIIKSVNPSPEEIISYLKNVK